jgi:signal transduction histidine kinase
MMRRHGAPLAEVVAATRRRNAIVSIAVLAVLIGAFVLLAFIARRAEMLRQQQLAFVAGITHELNTPLAAIESAGENLADGIVVERDHVVRYGTAIVKESRRLSDIVAQVLTYAGMQARSARRHHEALDVEPLVTSAVAACAWIAEQSGVKIETSIAGDLPRVDGNREELVSAIRNLVMNAIRHGGDGQWVGVRAFAERDEVVISVEDRGRGVAPEFVPDLFERFTRSEGSRVSAGGTGLGLAIARSYARAHGGDLLYEDAEPHGACFRLVLPNAG